MLLKHLSIKRLYGYLSKEIDLKDQITLLVGINGSGKTSVLNVINWLLLPSLPDLCTTEFEELSLLFNWKKKDYVIRCRHSGNNLSLQIEGGGDLVPLTVVLELPPTKIPRDSLPNFRERYAGLRPDSNEAKTWRFLSVLPKPAVIGLDRHLRSLRAEPRLRLQSREVGPIEEVQRLAQDGFAYYRNEAIRFNDELRDKILLLAFDVDISKKTSTRKNVKISNEQIAVLERRVRTYLEESSLVKSATSQGKHVMEAFSSYFNQIKESVPDQTAGGETELETRAVQFKRLQRLISVFEEFEKSLEQAYRRIHIFLKETNQFFRDSAKQLMFTPRNNELAFDVLDQAGKPQGRMRSVELLSSGEKQILILLTHICFNSEKVFILDEPELSLHPKWQDEFLDSVARLMSPGTQLIIATHSPSIVGTRTDSCLPLLPYNT